MQVLVNRLHTKLLYKLLAILISKLIRVSHIHYEGNSY